MKKKVGSVRDVLVLCTLILTAAGCKTTSVIYGVTINGMVYDFDNRPVGRFFSKILLAFLADDKVDEFLRQV